MKKIIISALVSLTAFFAFAGGIENKTNMSTGYLRNPSRNTESERVEAAFYNIAGTAFMKDGLYIEAGNQFILKEYKNSLATNLLSAYIEKGTSYNDETTVFLYPNAEIVYKLKNFAFFANFGIYAGGGKLEYSEGTAATALAFLGKAQSAKTAAEGYLAAAQTAYSNNDMESYQANAAQAQTYANMANLLLGAATNHSLTINSITYGEQLGLAYKIKDFISLSAGIRFLEGNQTLKLESGAFDQLTHEGNEVSCKANAFGLAPVFGIHIRPVEELNIAAQLQLKTSMKYDVSNIKGKTTAAEIGITEDTKFHSDLPTALNLGVGYQITEPLYISSSFNYYFNKSADCNSIISKNDYDDSFEIALGADYKFNEKWLASLGAAYGNQGIKDDSNNIFNPVLDSFQIGFGGEYHPIKELTVTAGGTYVKYFESDYYLSNTYKTELNKKVFMLSLGLTYKPF